MNYGFIPTEACGNPNKQSLKHVSDIVGDGAGECVRLYKYYEKTTGGILLPRDQYQTSSCVGQATSTGCDIVAAVAIAGLGISIEWLGRVAAEAMYAGSRYEIGHKEYGMSMWGKGSQVPYAAEFAQKFGLLFQKKYGDDVDLTQFDEDRCNEWESKGVPDALEVYAHENLIRDFVPINSYEELRAAIKNGHPCVVGSSFGFKGQPYRDADGMLKNSGTWDHALVFLAYDEVSRRHGVFIMNSWGPDWVGGPKRFPDDPDGGFWIDPDTADAMCKRGEVVALSGTVGFKRQKLVYDLL